MEPNGCPTPSHDILDGFLAQVLELVLLGFAPVALVIGIFPRAGHDFFVRRHDEDEGGDRNLAASEMHARGRLDVGALGRRNQPSESVECRLGNGTVAR